MPKQRIEKELKTWGQRSVPASSKKEDRLLRQTAPFRKSQAKFALLWPCLSALLIRKEASGSTAHVLLTLGHSTVAFLVHGHHHRKDSGATPQVEKCLVHKIPPLCTKTLSHLQLVVLKQASMAYFKFGGSPRAANPNQTKKYLKQHRENTKNLRKKEAQQVILETLFRARLFF